MAQTLKDPDHVQGIISRDMAESVKKEPRGLQRIAGKAERFLFLRNDPMRSQQNFCQFT